MDTLIPIQKSKGGRDVVSARALHQFLEVGTRFDMWWNRRLDEYTFFTKGADYHGPILSESQVEDYVITLDMAKELSMVERNEKGAAARRYFIECEKSLRQLAEAPRPVLPTTYKEALAALLVEVEEKERIEQELALAAPKVAFYEAVAVSTNAVAFARAAQMLKIPRLAGRNRLVKQLKADGVLQANRLPYQSYVDAGYFEVQVKTYQPGSKAEKGSKGTRVTSTTRVTPKGLAWLTKRYTPTPAPLLTT